MPLLPTLMRPFSLQISATFACRLCYSGSFVPSGDLQKKCLEFLCLSMSVRGMRQGRNLSCTAVTILFQASTFDQSVFNRASKYDFISKVDVDGRHHTQKGYCFDSVKFLT